MVDYASGSQMYSNNGLYDFSTESNRQVVEKFVQNLQSEGDLSDAEIKFLSQSKEKRSSAKFLEQIFSTELTITNYEEIFCLSDQYRKYRCNCSD